MDADMGTRESVAVIEFDVPALEEGANCRSGTLWTREI